MRLFLFVGLALAAAGCDRVPIDPVTTDLLVSDPDLGVVFLEDDLSLRLTPAGPSGPLTLRIRNKEIRFDSTQGAFLYSNALYRGLNVFPLSVTDEAGGVRFDTLYAVHLPIQREPVTSPDEGTRRAGAAVATLSLVTTVVTGGVGDAGTALATASSIRYTGVQVRSEEVALVAARTGHTAMPVAGGALLLGGATTPSPTRPADFVRQPEWIGPDRLAQPVTILGDLEGPARMGHVARALTLGEETYVYLLGGRVPSGMATSVSDRIEVFRVLPPEVPGEAPRLARLSPASGASGFATLAGAAFAPTGATSAAAFGLSGDEGVSLALTWSVPGTPVFPFRLDVAPTPPLQTPRTEAAAVDLGDGLVLVVGGRDAAGRPLASLEVYAAEAGRSFRLPESVQLAVARSGHVATILSGDRMVVMGGRPASGGPVVASEVFRL